MLGNNDCYPNYCSPNVSIAQAHYKAVFDVWRSNNWLPESAQSTFEKGGYYSRQVDEIVFIGLNRYLNLFL